MGCAENIFLNSKKILRAPTEGVRRAGWAIAMVFVVTGHWHRFRSARHKTHTGGANSKREEGGGCADDGGSLIQH